MIDAPFEQTQKIVIDIKMVVKQKQCFKMQK